MVAEEAGFELFITADQEITYQQNLTGRKMALLVLSTNNWDYVRAAIATIMSAINAVTPGSYAEVEIRISFGRNSGGLASAAPNAPCLTHRV